MMSKTEKNGYFLVREEILPEAIKKTIRVKEIHSPYIYNMHYGSAPSFPQPH